MKRITRTGIIVSSLGLCLVGVGSSSAYLPQPSAPQAPSVAAKATPASAQTAGTTQPQLLQSYGKLPLSFEANQGQTDPHVKFLSRGHGYTLFLTDTEAVLTLKKADPAAKDTPKDMRDRRQSAQRPHREKVDYTTVRMKLEGANAKARVSGLAELPGKVNYFIGNDPSNWHTNIPTFAKVQFTEVYPGIDLVYYGHQRRLEYDLVVSPGANPDQIKLAFEGAEEIQIDEKGDLILKTNGGELHLKKPLVYQEVGGSRQPIAAQYVVHKQEKVAGLEVGVTVAAYDTRKPLIIDPVLLYSTYLGGSGDDVGNGIAVDGSGNVYAVGSTDSTDFPTANDLQAANAGSYDAFVVKLNPAGSALVYSTYLGGSGLDEGGVIAVDGSGNVYVGGLTDSTDLPTVNPLQATFGGGVYDGFLAKLNPTGSALVYSTYIGGSGEEGGGGIAVDGSGNLYVEGFTQSTDFPTVNAFQATFGGGSFDAVVLKLNPAGSALVYSTYLGGSGDDSGSGIAVDGSGNAYVTGITGSTDFPGTVGSPIQATYGGGSFDAFVTKLKDDGSALVYSTYLGGSGDEKLSSRIAVDSAGNAYATGATPSTDFPTANPFQGACNGCSSGAFDAFVTKVKDDGSALVYSTYLGGSGDDSGSGIAVDSVGNVYVTGLTSSTDFPTASPLQASLSGGSDVFVTKLNTTGSALLYSTYLGGSGNELKFDSHIAVDSAGNAYVTGVTDSTDFPTANPLQATYGGGFEDAFVAKIISLTAPLVEDDGTYTVDRTQLHATWSGYPAELGEFDFQDRIVRCPTGVTDPLDATCQEAFPITEVGSVLETTRTGLTLDYCLDPATDCPTYYIGVRGVQVTGAQSPEGFSDGILALDPLGDPDGDGETNQDELANHSNPLDPNSRPGVTTIHLVKGFNLISIPADLTEQLGVEAPTAYQVLPLLGSSAEIDRVQRVAGDLGQAQEARYTGDTPAGEDFPVIPGEGMMVYARLEKTLTFTSVLCPAWTLRVGINLVGTPCGGAGSTAFGLLQAIGERTVVSSIQRFNPITGQFETAGYDSNGQPMGVDFPIVPGEGYFVTMKSEVLGFRP